VRRCTSTVTSAAGWSFAYSRVVDEKDQEARWVPLALLILVGAAFVSWARAAAKPMPEAPIVLEPDALVHIETAPWLVFRPIDRDPTLGLILYPGGRMDSRAYAPIARSR
jgi:hypothetical protein